MAYRIEYDPDGKPLISGLECACPCEHTTPTQDIYVGSSLVEKIPGYICTRGLGTHCVLVADNITYEVAGRRVSQTLKAAGFDVIECVIVREGHMEPDERAVGEVLLSKVFRNFALKLVSVIIGAVIYYIVLQAVLQLGLNTNDLKLLTALIVAIFLTVPYWKQEFFAKKEKTAGKEGNHA